LFRKVRGFRDIYGEEIGYWRKIEEVIYSLSESFGYSEYKMPVLEKAEVFDRGIGSTTDIVEKEMFAFKDRNDDLLALRPEGTAGVVRGVVENKLYAASGVKKYYYYGPMFRRERPQKGRYRQFYQYGVEVFGSTSPLVDAEVIQLLCSFFDKCGIGEFLRLEINSIGCPECRPDYKNKLIEYFSKYENELCDDCRRRLNTNPLRILDCKVPGCKNVAADAPVMVDYLCSGCKKHFDSVKYYLGVLNINYDVNPFMVRGLDYYVRTAFEMITDKFEANSTVGAGGRYDGLVKQLGGPDYPGIGFAVGIDRLVNLIKEAGLIYDETLDIFMVMFPETVDTGLKLLKSLRDENWGVDMDFELGSMKSQMKKANRSQVSYVVIMGEEELGKNAVTLKNMADGEQELVRLDELKNILSQKFKIGE